MALQMECPAQKNAHSKITQVIMIVNDNKSFIF
jgi:hypothetical protein